MTKTIMVQGTGSSVGKSVMATALCRIFSQDGFEVAPFKAQNMALNSFVTKEGGEMGRAQVTQAQAAGIEPHADMNPILIKPMGDSRAQIIIQGKPIGDMSAVKYHNYKRKALSRVRDSFNRLKKQYEVIVIEGAGSPAEINLKKDDIVNMKMAEVAKAPVVLVGDIDKGGVFASLVGTLELLSKSERCRIKGFIINKFRGDKRLLKSGLGFLEKKTGKPVLGVIPYSREIMVPEEDSVALESLRPEISTRRQAPGKINIAVIKLPYISNFTDFDALKNEPQVKLEYASDKNELSGADIIIIPGTKNTVKDLIWLKENGLAGKLLEIFESMPMVSLVGICGGYQMMGRFIYDSGGIESRRKRVAGLGLLPIATTFKSQKKLSQIQALEIDSGIELEGYEIHHGRTVSLEACEPVFKILSQKRTDGAKIENGRIWGAYLHGIFDNNLFRKNFLNKTRKNLGLESLPEQHSVFNLEDEFDKLADLVRKNIDMKLLYGILND